MKLIEAEIQILALNQPILETNDISACLNISPTHASKIMERLTKLGKTVRLLRGKWAISKNIDPLLLPEYLTAPLPAYVSLQTALFFHGMISQIPNVIYAVTLARTHLYKTPLATISTHHLQANFFFDFTVIPKSSIKIATPEKALIDFLYLSPAKSILFQKLPELEFPEFFQHRKALKIIDAITSIQRQRLVLQRYSELLAKSKR